MTSSDFDYLTKLLWENSAIALEPGKEYLVDSRLTPLARKHGLGTVSELVRRLRTGPVNGLIDELVESMVTSETSFFRDSHPFESLRDDVLPRLIAARRPERSLALWSAAAASGQEPYSIAMILREHFPELRDWKVTFWATDISGEMIRRCREGLYSQVEVGRGLDADWLRKYFRQVGDYWRVRDDLASTLDFRTLNLAAPWPAMPSFDLIFLRNVMIYFDVETKKTILERVARVLRPDGYLVLGGAETTFTINDSYRSVKSLKSGYYQLTTD